MRAMNFFYLITLQWMDADDALKIETFDGVIDLASNVTPQAAYEEVYDIARKRAGYRGLPAVLLYQLIPNAPMNRQEAIDHEG